MRNRRNGIRSRKEQKISKILGILLILMVLIIIIIIAVQSVNQKSTEKRIASIIETLNNLGAQSSAENTNITNTANESDNSASITPDTNTASGNTNPTNALIDSSNITNVDSNTDANTNSNIPNVTPENNPFGNTISNTIPNTATNETPTTPSKNTTFTMAVTGDIMCHNTMYEDAYKKSSEEYDFTYMFEDVKLHLQTADITVGNLETVFAGSKAKYSSYPKFNTPEILAKNLKKVGFDVLSTANNHCMDQGYSGLVSTLNNLDEVDVAHTGTYRSKKEQQNVLIKNVKGLKIAFLSFTVDTNGISIPKNKSFSVNLADEKTILSQLKLAKAKKPDLICVSMHWGTEYQTKPDDKQKKLANLLFKNGADIILGNHPHVAQPMEKRKIKQADGSTKDGFVIYSLGNFMADQNKPNTRSSAILNLQITKNNENGKITIDKASYIPTYIYKKPTGKTKRFKILDIKNTIAAYKAKADRSIGKATYDTLVNELKNVEKLIGKEISK